MKEIKRGTWDLGRQEGHPFLGGAGTDSMRWQLVGGIVVIIIDDLQSRQVNVALSIYQCIL